LKEAIFGHPEFTAFTTKARKLLSKWQKGSVPLLNGFDRNGHPKALIETIAEDLLATFRAAPLLDAYDIYQHLMDYWAETMQDDCYLISEAGWCGAAQPRLIVEDKNKKSKARPDFIIGKKKYQAELIPPALIVRRWFAEEQKAIEKLEASLAAVQQELEELVEENSGEEGAFSELERVNRAEVSRLHGELVVAERDSRGEQAAKLTEAPVPYGNGEAEPSEQKILLNWLNLDSKETELSKELKSSQEALTEKVAAKYPKLTEDEIQTVVVDDKWLATIAGVVQGELDRVSQTLTGRIRQLAERYATPLPQLTDDVATLAKRVNGHLKRMGAVWK
jgi:type I restriction enzyme M protein